MYTLDLTQEDLDTIHFVGNRYSWSEALQDWKLTVGQNEIPEHIAWYLREAFEEDTKGGHNMFPMLSHDSELAKKLLAFWDSII